MKLSDDLKYWRAERPDEWTMDDFVRKAKKLEADLKAQAEPVATLIGFTKEEVKEMVEAKYGSLVWGIEDRDGKRVVTAYPNDEGGVFIADE